MRSHLLTDLPYLADRLGKKNLIDRDIRTAQYVHGPEFRHVDFLRQSRTCFGNLGYNFYSEDFYNEVCRGALKNQGRVDKIQSYMQDRCENELLSLQPKYIHVWEAIICDIFYSPGMEEQLSGMLDTCRANGEFESITVDCAVKPTLPPLGQVNRNRVKSKKENPSSAVRRAVPRSSYRSGILRVSLVGGADVSRKHIGDGVDLHGSIYCSSEELCKFYVY